MFNKRKLKAEVVRLTYRVKELEERLCPCEQHDWVVTRKEYTWHRCGTEWVFCDGECATCVHQRFHATNKTEVENDRQRKVH